MSSSVASPMRPEFYIGRRFLAALVDGILISIALNVTLSLLSMPNIPFLSLVLLVAYEVIMITKTGQTVGKMILGVKVIDAKTGKIPEQNQVLKRTIIKCIPFVGIFLFFQMVFGKLPLHDDAAGTRVARA